jgi:hypothetical protein
MSTTDRERALGELEPEREASFPPEEYAARVERIRRGMAAAGVQTLFLSAPDSICYVDGYRSEWYQGQSPVHQEFYPSSGVAIHVDEPVPVHTTTRTSGSWLASPRWGRRSGPGDTTSR